MSKGAEQRAGGRGARAWTSVGTGSQVGTPALSFVTRPNAQSPKWTPKRNVSGCINSASSCRRAEMTTEALVSAADSQSNRQYLWIKIFYATSSVAVVLSGRATSLPF